MGWDHDTDDDDLIEITSPAQLDVIWHDLDGDDASTHTDHTTMFPDAARSIGCRHRECAGYELTASLDLTPAATALLTRAMLTGTMPTAGCPSGDRKPSTVSTLLLTATGIRFPTCSCAGRMPTTSDFSAPPARTPVIRNFGLTRVARCRRCRPSGRTGRRPGASGSARRFRRLQRG